VDPRADVERVAAARAAVAPSTLVSADANEGYSVGEAVRVCAELERYDLLCLEQPLVRWDLAGLARLRTATRVPIMVDESVMSLADMVAAIRHGAADYVFLKLDNYGGIHPSRQVATVARAGGVVPIPGGSSHTGIGAAALAHLAVALDLTLPGGYNGPATQLDPACTFIKDGGLVYEEGGGVLRVPDGPGLGIELDEAAVREYRVNEESLESGAAVS
jgi:muconate cycloisomerase